MNDIERAIAELLENELHLKKVTLDSNVQCVDKIECYKYGGEAYIRLSSFRCPPDAKLHYCIEYAENEEMAKNNVFDDAWLYGISLGKDEILREIRNDLLADLQ